MAKSGKEENWQSMAGTKKIEDDCLNRGKDDIRDYFPVPSVTCWGLSTTKRTNPSQEERKAGKKEAYTRLKCRGKNGIYRILKTANCDLLKLDWGAGAYQGECLVLQRVQLS